MSGRRGPGEGSVYREGPYWVATVEVGANTFNARRVRRKVKGRTRAEVLRKAAEIRRQVEAGLVPADATTTVAEFLERWLTAVVAHRVDSPNTEANYRAVVRTHLAPGLGSVPVGRLTPEQVDRFLAAKAAAGLSRSYVYRMRAVLADALRHAERRGIVLRNVAALSVMPKCQPTAPRRSLSLEEARSLLVAARGERLESLVACGLTLGLRPGELTGLLWADLDLDADPPVLSVSGSMKRRPDSSLYRGEVKRSTAGRRTIAVPVFVADSLRAHRRRQAEERLGLGEAWADLGLVFCSEVGTPLDPANVRKVFARVAKKAGIAATMPYTLRHSAASLLVDQGVGIDAVADLLGDDPRTLLRHYRHRVRPVVDAAAEPMQRLFGAAVGDGVAPLAEH